MILPSVPTADYVADRVGDRPPSLNSGLAHVLLTRSPAHARIGHPRLNPAWAPDDDTAYDLGTSAHAVLLEGRQLTVLPFADYRTKLAQAARDDAKAQGFLPVLEHQASDIASMVVTAKTALESCPDLEGYKIADYLPERTILWQQDGAHLRCRPDWLSQDWKVIVSYKTTKASAEPNSFIRTIMGSGYSLQAAWEIAGVKAVTGVSPHYVWAIQEVTEPFAVSLMGMSPALLAMAQSQMAVAVDLWRTCLERDHWPGYPERICYADPPAYALGNWNERLTLSGANLPDDVEAL